MSALELPPSTDSVPVARQFARRAAGDSAADVETLVLLVSEVVTNAVLHARSDIRLDVQPAAELVRVEVHDGGSGFKPASKPEPRGADGGFGLFLVERMASRWGVDSRDGTRVWFELDLASGGT